MTCHVFSALVLILAALHACPASLHAEDLAEKGIALMKEEALNGIRLEAPQKDVVKLLGKAPQMGPDIEWEALGAFVQEWKYPAQGIALQMASEKKGGTKSVLIIVVHSPGKGATRKGIHPGSTEAEVREAYGALEDKEAGKPGELFVAGSVYGGLIFRFEQGKVTEIFLGAAAE